MNSIISIVWCSENISNSEKFSKTSAIPDVMREALLNETGKDRVKRIFTNDEFGLSPELKYVVQSGSTAVFISAVYGGLKEINNAKNEFVRKNVATAFESQHRARRNLTDTMSLAALRGSFNYAVKFGSFTTLYLLGTMTVANYRNKISVLEHAGCAALLGALSRLNYGVKGSLVAGTLGGFLGLIGGGVITAYMSATGTSLEELRYYQHEDHYAKILRRRKEEQTLTQAVKQIDN